MSLLRNALERYIRMRQGLGYKYDGPARRLSDFVGFMEARGVETITVALAMAVTGRRRDHHHAGSTRLSARSCMSIPLLVRLSDSQVKATDGVVAEVPNRVNHGRSISEQVGSGRLTVDQEALPPDLHIDPINGNVQPRGQLRGAQPSRLVGPSAALGGHPDSGAKPNPLHGDRQNLVFAIEGFDT